MENKICFKCGRELPIEDFYKHPKMKDGHLNKCKYCTRKDVHNNYEGRMTDESYIENERVRGREKYRRLYSKCTHHHNHPENSNTRRFVINQGINLSNMEIHHWNYNRPKDIFILSRKAHKRAHLSMEFDKQSNMFMYNGQLLDSAESHESALREIFTNTQHSFTHLNFQ